MADTTGPAPADHELKTWPEYWISLASGAKNFEVRRNDRGFHPGDTLLLREWHPDDQTYTGRSLRRSVDYVLRDAEQFGVAPGYVVLGLRAPATTGPAPATGITDEMIESAARVLGAAPAAGFVPDLAWSQRLTEEAREGYRSAARRVLHAALAGRTVVQLPAAIPDDVCWRAWEEFIYPRNAAENEPTAGFICAVHVINQWLAAESSGDGESR